MRMKRFCETLAGTVLGPAASADPTRLELFRAIADVKSMSAARMVVQDLLEWSQDLHGRELADLDERLAADSLPTLSLMRSRQDAQFGKILQRGFVSTEGEYQLLSARLADTDSPLSSADRSLAERLLAAFSR